MKKLMILLFILSSSLGFAKENTGECQLIDFVLIDAVGTTDYDPKEKKLVRVYPEINKLTPDLPDLVSTKINLDKKCLSEGLEVDLKIYAYRAPKRFMGGEEGHESHGVTPPGVWLDEPVVKHTHTLKANESLIEFEKINLAPVWAMPSEFFWFWTLRFEFSLRKDEKQISQFSKEVGAPLSH